MATYVIFSKVSQSASVIKLDERHKAVQRRHKSECPNVSFRAGFALDRGYEVLDIVEADSLEEVQRAAKIIEEEGSATTEVVEAFPWREFVAKRSRAA